MSEVKEMDRRSEFSVGQIFRRSGQKYERNNLLGRQQRWALKDIASCRTAHLGGHMEECADCGRERPHYNSCGNAHCPTCQGIRRKRWLDSRLETLLPVSYFHCIFTLPRELDKLVMFNQRSLYKLLFSCSSATLLSFAKKEFQAVPAIISTLHTWGQNLCRHPHVHILVTGGGLGEDGAWHRSNETYLFDVEELSADFKRRFLRALKRLKKNGSLQQAEKFDKVYEQIESKDWVVNCRKPFAGAEKVLEYLSRYVYRSAIANGRIKSIEDGVVTFDYKDYRDEDEHGLPKHKLMPLSDAKFIRRFLQHILPKGFRRSRLYGLLAGAKTAEKMESCRKIFAEKIEQIKLRREQDLLAKANKPDKKENDWRSCPHCGCCKFIETDFIPPQHPPPIEFHFFEEYLPYA